MARLVASGIGGPIRGKLGNVVLVATPDGAIARTLTRARDPRSPAQIAARERQTVCAQAWSDLDDEADARWRRFAQSLEISDPRTGAWTRPRPDNLFGAHYSRMLLVDPQAAPPQAPPEGAFFGDAIRVSVFLPLGRGRCGAALDGTRVSEGGSTPSLPSPKGEEPDEARLTFLASGPNAPGVVTELLTQPLVTRKRRTYLEKYRHAALARYEAGRLVAEVPCAAGWYACAYRFIRADTGQATALAEIGIVRVG